MIKKRAAGNERRARNIIWNAAGHYDIEPAFMAYFPDGAPDYYFDMVIGLVYKWLDAGRLEEFFESYSSDRRSDEFDAFLWLGLENCVYEKELSERPVIQGMRKDRAGLFFKKQQTLSRQQMMYQSMPVYTQQEIRWSGVLGRRMPIMSAREKRMSEDLMFSGGLDTDGVTEAMSETEVLYGEENLKNILNKSKDLKIEEIVSELENDINVHTHNTDQSDDITTLIFKYNGEFDS